VTFNSAKDAIRYSHLDLDLMNTNFAKLMIRLFIKSFICPALFFVSSASVLAGEIKKNDDENVEWALGLGLGVFEYNLYPGSKATNRLILPAPYFTYLSSRFEIDRGIKSFIYHSNIIVIDISADFLLPVDSDDTEVRKGMPDLDFMLQAGPSLEFKLNDKNKNYFEARFEIPLRLAFTTSFSSVENIGYLIEPRFSFDHQRSSKTGLSHKATMGLKFATQDFHAYYYDVAPEFATAMRPEYNSDAGYGGSFFNYRVTYKTGGLVYWMFLRYQSLRGAEFEDSPLVEKLDYSLIGFGFSWIFAGNL
jgi:outer membrane scaffolding protein for murein synthesis (MipA/OmpV family)